MQPVDHTIFESSLTKVGLFRCLPDHPLFTATPIESGHLIVFPRTTVGVSHSGSEMIVADPNTVVLYNQGQVCQRHKLSERGDWCEWFTFRADVIVEALRHYDSTAEEHLEEPFRLSHGPSDAESYLLQRLVVEHIMNVETPDTLFIEEVLLRVLARVIERAYSARGHTPKTPTAETERAHAELTHEARVILTEQFRDRVTLERMAEQLYTSPYHLCRVFREQTDSTINHYLHQLRLRTALEQILDGPDSLNDVAFDLGYASHSHFTQAFRRSFGLLPSTLQRDQAATLLHQMSNHLVA